MRAALVKDVTPVEPAKTLVATSNSAVAKADKVAAKQQEKKDKEARQAEAQQAGNDAKEKDNKDAKQPVAADANPATPLSTSESAVKTEQVLTETWSYQLPADE
ncbi:hypothetical protein D3C78_1520950 [compost metagenome]